MTQQEVALALNLPLKTVQNIEYVALRKLRKRFLEIACESEWFELIFNCKEKNPRECYLEDNLSI
jgi:hypothetical protein